MKQLRRFCVLGLVALTSMVSLTLAAQAGDTAAIQQELNSRFKLTRTTADRLDIVVAGDVATIHKPGLVMFSGTAVPSTNNYKGGVIGQGMGTALIMANPNTVQRRFVPEEKFWITDIRVQKDGVLFQLYSDPYNARRFYGTLKVAFPNKKEVPPVDVALGLISEVLTVVPSDDQADQDAQPAPAPLPRKQARREQARRDRSADVPDGRNAPAPDAAPEPPLPNIAPPPPPSDIPPPTISLGELRNQVTSDFGQPVRIARMGEKEIYFYKDMKVTFTDGKVSNVE